MPLSLADFPAALGGTKENSMVDMISHLNHNVRLAPRPGLSGSEGGPGILTDTRPHKQQIGQMLSTSGRFEIGLWLLRLRGREFQERLALAFEPRARRSGLQPRRAAGPFLGLA